jgi:hypothetical protein
MWTCENCHEAIEDQFDSCWKCAGLPDPIGRPLGANPKPFKRRPDTPLVLWMRCWIIACVLLLSAQFLLSGHGATVREVMQYLPRLIGAVCGLVLFVSSLFCFVRDWRLACLGLAASIPSILLALLPTW